MIRLGKLRRYVCGLMDCELPSIAKYISERSTVSATRPERGMLAGNEWDDYTRDIDEEFRRAPMSFLRQPTISRTVHPNQQKLARAYLDEMSVDSFCRHEILPRLHDVPLGDPYLCTFFPTASPMSVQHAYYLWLLKAYLGLFLPGGGVDHVLEIGGGYGNFCRMVCGLGYAGRYVIADLPQMHRIQRHYLAHALSSKTPSEQIEFRALTDGESFPKGGVSLLVATFSLSEMPIETRRLLESQYNRFDYIFIAYNRAFGNVDNQEYFGDLAEELKVDFNVRQVADRHRSAWFLLCDRIRSDGTRARSRSQ